MGYSLGDFINQLKDFSKSNPGKLIKIGIKNPHSFRGYHRELAFERGKSPQKIEDMILVAQSALGVRFEGYKGGYYTMDKHTPVWVSSYGTSYGPTLLSKLTVELILNSNLKRIS